MAYSVRAFHGEDGRGWEVSIVQRRDVRLEVWRLGVLQGPRNAQPDRLVDRDWAGAHEQGPVEELVAVPIIGHRVEVVLGEGPTPRHVVTATIVPSRQLVRRRRSMMVDSTGSAVGDEFRGCDLDVEGLTGHIRFGAVAAGDLVGWLALHCSSSEPCQSRTPGPTRTGAGLRRARYTAEISSRVTRGAGPGPARLGGRRAVRCAAPLRRRRLARAGLGAISGVAHRRVRQTLSP